MGKPREAEHAVVRVTDFVHDRRGTGHPRWVVLAEFVGVDGAEPRCIGYRVRVVPACVDAMDAVKAASIIAGELESDGKRRRPAVYRAAETSAPAEGIPRRVFEVASQARLLDKARQRVGRHPAEFDEPTKRLLDRQQRPRVGRPPVRSLGEKLAILRDVEQAFAHGGTLDDVAAAHYMSRAAVRDLLSWARKDAVPPLFTGAGPGRRGGALTPQARALLNKKVT